MMIRAAAPSILLLVLVASTTSASSDFALPSNSSTHIIDGRPAGATTYPFFVAPTGNVLCGGALFWPDVVLTAAHCQGAYNFTGATANIGGTTGFGANANEAIAVRGWLTHPGFKTIPDNDIMLVFLDRLSNTRPTTFNQDASVPTTGQELTAIGHGRTGSSEGSISSILKEAKVTAVADSDCVKFFASVAKVSSNTTFCTKYLTGGTCKGDSGGPLMDASGRIMGLVSFGLPGCPTSGLTGYTRVSSYYTWMFEMVCRFSRSRPTDCPDRWPSSVIPTDPTVPPPSPTTARPPSPTAALPPSPTADTRPNSAKRCGLLGLSIFCLNGCGLIGRILGLCD